ncbi:hypothetical protein AUW17_07805 [Tenacibaculum dicentrarchi]|nr:hypothetical protein AUW17_07805 [Tenacibaculum dicentrarchi]
MRSILGLSNRVVSNEDNSNEEVIIDIPNDFSELEKITRTIFSPMNVKKDDSLRNNAFTTPANLDEVSVNRLNYTTPNFIKKISKFISNPDKGRSYLGIAVIDVKEIYESDSDIVYTPNEITIDETTLENKFHSDIKIGFVKEAGNQLPMKYVYKVEQMVQKSRFYKDNNPDSESWESGDLV